MSEDTCRAVKEIVERFGPDWHSRLDEVGEALDHGVCDAVDPEACGIRDHQKIPLPRTWRKRGKSWPNPPDNACLIKAIKERLKQVRPG
jgi:hypothetical protein